MNRSTRPIDRDFNQGATILFVAPFLSIHAFHAVRTRFRNSRENRTRRRVFLPFSAVGFGNNRARPLFLRVFFAHASIPNLSKVHRSNACKPLLQQAQDQARWETGPITGNHNFNGFMQRPGFSVATLVTKIFSDPTSEGQDHVTPDDKLPQIQTNSSVAPESSAHERPKAAWTSALPRWRPDPEAAEAEKHACETNPEKPWGQPPQDFQNPQSSRRRNCRHTPAVAPTGTGNPRTGCWRMFRNPTANRFVQEALLKSCTSLETRNTLCIYRWYGGGRVGWGGAITFMSSGTRMECMLCSQGGSGGVGWGNNVHVKWHTHGMYVVQSGWGVVGWGGAITFMSTWTRMDWDLLLHFHTHVMLRSGIFFCTCTDTTCYALGSSLALAHTHVMLRSGIFSCTFTRTSCYALGSSLALAHTRKLFQFCWNQPVSSAHMSSAHFSWRMPFEQQVSFSCFPSFSTWIRSSVVSMTTLQLCPQPSDFPCRFGLATL